MCRRMSKQWLVVCFAACSVIITRGAETLKATQITFLDEDTDPCFSKPCRNDGVCFANGTEYACDCKEPYSGKQCEKHPCLTHPCLNDGACIAVEDSYACVCNEPFHGRHCENDPCSSDPCQNGGSCSVAGISFNCSCVESYFGERCEIECDCGNKSKACRIKDNKKVCICRPGYSQGEDGMCQACDCGKNSYECQFINGTKKCFCSLHHAEFEGKCVECDCGLGFCEFVEGEKKCSCYSHQRLFEGNCKYCYCGQYGEDCGFSDIGEIVCNCQDGYIQKGYFCEEFNSTDNATTDPFSTWATTHVDECNCGENSLSCSLNWRLSKLCTCKPSYAQRNDTCARTCNFSEGCLNGGRCAREGSAYFCQCLGTYAGDRCETDVCENLRYDCYAMRAECTRKGDSGVCECPAGTAFSRISRVCEKICDDSTCLNGRCEVIENNYICVCYEGYSGLNCERVHHITTSVPLGYLMIFCIGIVIFAVAAIVASCWVKKLRKTIEEDRIKLRNA